ncbi:MAG: DUF3050 domain-containing protein [Planctomycetes bacterium]|nr:DUF3050 domain-containing protein [Planctomycetota bacterium]
MKTLQSNLDTLKSELHSHPLYASVNAEAAVKVFMQTHVFAVWDFMCLLKTLQSKLTCVEQIWTPTPNSKLRRFINEITLDEESDYDRHGAPLSHFEMYLDAMRSAGADTKPIENFLADIRSGINPIDAVRSPDIPLAAQEFVTSTFQAIHSNQAHIVASFFTHGREDVIPGMFIALLDSLAQKDSERWQDLNFYFKRHVELDGGSHGDLARSMIKELCDNDELKTAEAHQAGCDAVVARIKMWDKTRFDCLATSV